MIDSLLPLSWPLPPLTDLQIAEARSCYISAEVERRYPPEIGNEGLDDAYQPTSACDLAILAAAYAQRTPPDVPVPVPGIQAFHRAFMLNPAHALNLVLFPRYIGSSRLVAAPLFEGRTIERLVLTRSYWYFAEQREDDQQVVYTLLITAASTHPQVYGTLRVFRELPVYEELAINTISTSTQVELVQQMLRGMTDLLPISARPEQLYGLDDCNLNAASGFGQWELLVVLDDGTTILGVQDSGPWVFEWDSQHYLQYSYEMARWILQLVDALDLPNLTDFPLSNSELSELGCEFYGNEWWLMESAFPNFDRTPD